jgi:hypothetical protein
VHEVTGCAAGGTAPERPAPGGPTAAGAAPDEAEEPDETAMVAVVASSGTPTAAMTAVARSAGLGSRQKAIHRVMPTPRKAATVPQVTLGAVRRSHVLHSAQIRYDILTWWC